MLIRYPGSKDQHVKFLMRHVLPLAEKHQKVVEPFAGTASITFELLKRKAVQEFWINDADSAMISLWKVVKERPQELIESIKNYTPNTVDFYDFKENPGDDEFTQAFRKVVLHQVSYSGLGAMAGGPLGGKNQSGKYLIDCRWRPEMLRKKIEKCSELLNSVPGKFTHGSYQGALESALAAGFFAYLDPPYYAAGKALYKHGELDHAKLATVLSNAPAQWVMSYDDDEKIRELYSWAEVESLAVRSHLHHRSITDVVILPLTEEATSYAW